MSVFGRDEAAYPLNCRRGYGGQQDVPAVPSRTMENATLVKERQEESGRPESEAGTQRLFVINNSKSIACHD